MDDVELQFMKGVTKDVSQFKNKVTDGQTSKYTGFGNDRDQEIARKIIQEQKKQGEKGDAANAASPYYHDDNMEQTVKPLEITPEMVKPILELEGNNLLPEYADKNKKIIGNPSQIQSSNQSVQQESNELKDPNDPNQLEFNFDKITVDHVYEQYKEILKELNFLKKEVNTIKGLMEVNSDGK